MKKIVGVGNALVDVLVSLADDSLIQEMGLAKGGMTLIDDNMHLRLTERMCQMNPYKATGGSACNTILALANLGDAPGFIGKVGDDDTGRYFASECHRQGIDARLLVCDRHTGVANTFVSPGGERTFGTYLGAAATMTAQEINSGLFCGYGLLYIEGYLVQNHELVEKVCRVAKEEGLKICMDLASYNVVLDDLDFFRYLVESYVDIVFANEEESAAFTGGKTPEKALQEIAAMVEIAVVKLGARGASAMCGADVAVVPARKVDVVDTTAAGDFFAGGFLFSYVRGGSLERCLRTGALLSESVIQVMGTRLPQEKWECLRAGLSV